MFLGSPTTHSPMSESYNIFLFRLIGMLYWGMARLLLENQLCAPSVDPEFQYSIVNILLISWNFQILENKSVHDMWTLVLIIITQKRLSLLMFSRNILDNIHQSWLPFICLHLLLSWKFLSTLLTLFSKHFTQLLIIGPEILHVPHSHHITKFSKNL